MGTILKQRQERKAFTDEAANAGLRGALQDLQTFYDDTDEAGNPQGPWHYELLRALEKAAERVVYETVE
jgi:hypothetical protein